MKSRTPKIIFAILSLLLIFNCSSSRKIIEEPREKEIFKKEAMRHVIEGAVFDLLGQPKNALVKYHQASEADTTSPGILIAMAEDYFIIDEIPTSVRLAKKALRLDPNNLDALDLLAISYEHLEEYDNAIDIYKKIISIEYDNTEALYNLTFRYIQKREYDKALNSYNRILDNGFDIPDFRLRIGHLFLQNRAFDQAEQVYSALQTDSPGFEPSYLALAAVAKAKGDTLAAIGWYKKAIDYNPNFQDAKAELQNVYTQRHLWDEAIRMYTRYVSLDSSNLTDKLQLGNFYFKKGDSLKAMGIFEKSVLDHPKSERPYLALAAVQKAFRDTLEAEKTYAAALQISSRFFDARNRLKDIYVAQKRWNEAIQLFEPLMDSDSTFVGSRLEISNLFMQKGDTLEAIKKAEALFETHADDWRVPVTLGRYHFLNENNQKAADYFDLAVKLRKDIPGLWVLRGVNFMQMDSLDLAMDNFKNSLQTFPDDPELNYYLGAILSRKQKHAEAVKYLAASQQKDPTNAQTLLALAAAYDELHQYDRSEPFYQQLYKMQPGAALILNNYAYHLSVRGIRLVEALQMAKKALEADPDNAAYLDTIGWIYYQSGDYENAKQYISKSLQVRQDSPEVLEHLGDVYHKLGDRQKAEYYWHQALEFGKSKRILDKLGQASQ